MPSDNILIIGAYMPIPEAVEVTLTCMVCGQPFTWLKRWKQVENRAACSKACIGKLGQLRKRGLLPNVLEEERACVGCGVVFISKRRSQSIAFPEFCSPPCANKGAGDRKRDDSWEREQEQDCEVCGITFMAKRRRIRDAYTKTCSLECTAKARESNLKRQCRHCGAIFHQQRSVVERGGNGGCFCTQECFHAFQAVSGALAVGRKMDRGYVLLYAPNHPHANRKYVYEHRLVMEKVLGRYLEPHENVHHIDGQRDNNDRANLELWVSPQPSGQRAQDVYRHDAERLGQENEALREENLILKQRIADLEAELAALRMLHKEEEWQVRI